MTIQTTTTNTPSTRKARTMARRLTVPVLALGITATLFTSSPAAHAAKATSRPAQVVSLSSTLNAFGRAAVHGPDAAINSYATPALLASAPAGHLINLFGPMQNPASGYSYVVANATATRATAVVRWMYVPVLKDRLTLVMTASGWKISGIEYLPNSIDVPAVRYQINRLDRALHSRNNAAVNSIATRALLRKGHGSFYNLLGTQNPPSAVRATVQGVRGTSIAATLVFSFGGKATVTRQSSWVYEDGLWKMATISD